MAIVMHVLGNCPKCGATDSFGNVDVYETYIYRGCIYCRYFEHHNLPAIRKKIIYLDQFFFSHAFRGTDTRFIDAAERIVRATSLQLLAVPFSSIHEDETHQWSKRNELIEFIKATTRGVEFVPSYDVERTQLIKAFQAWLTDGPCQYHLELRDALSDDTHGWDGYMRIDVGRYMGDIELTRDLKRRSVEQLVELFGVWRKHHTSFTDDLQAEHAVAAQNYVDSYLQLAMRVMHGECMAILDAPIISMVVEGMLRTLPSEQPANQKLMKCAEFFASNHFKNAPYQRLSALIFATLRAEVRRGAYKNRERALKRLSGVFYDVKHIATYAPYVDGFIMDQSMADLVSNPMIALERTYGTKVFSLKNWKALLAWLDSLEVGMSDEHRAGLAAAYPYLSPAAVKRSVQSETRGP